MFNSDHNNVKSYNGGSQLPRSPTTLTSGYQSNCTKIRLISNNLNVSEYF